jgi:Uma2 family endonuclease
MGIANKIFPYYTYDDWLHWEGKWELIEGHPFAISPTPIPEHQRVAAEIRYALMTALKQSKCKNCRAYDPLDYKISNDTVLVPDILVICSNVTKKYLDFPPSLVVEILSPSTALKDRHTKYELYQQQGVLYYLIVDVDKQLMEVYHLVNGEYQLQTPTPTPEISLVADCTITPDFQNVFE